MYAVVIAACILSTPVQREFHKNAMKMDTLNRQTKEKALHAWRERITAQILETKDLPKKEKIERINMLILEMNEYLEAYEKHFNIKQKRWELIRE